MMLFREAASWPVKVARIPYDPPTDPARYLRAVALWRLASLYGLAVPDRSIGRHWSVPSLLDLLRTLPRGATELYFHPVTSNTHKYRADLPILLDERVRCALAGVSVSGMGELAIRRQSRGPHAGDRT